MSYQSTLEGSPMLTDFSAADTPKSEKKSLGLTSVLVLFLALASFLAGRATSGSTTAATATATVSGSAAAFDDFSVLCENMLAVVLYECDYDTWKCFYTAANRHRVESDFESCPPTEDPKDPDLCSLYRDHATEECAGWETDDYFKS